VDRHAYHLISRLKEHSDDPVVRISDWMTFFSFDAMGSIGFNRSFGMLERGNEDDFIKMMHRSMAPLAIFNQLSWALSLALRLTGAPEIKEMIRWTHQVLKERKKVEPKEKDIMSHLMNPMDRGMPL